MPSYALHSALFLWQCIAATGARFPSLWFGTIPSVGFPSPSQYDFSNYSLVLLGFTYPDPHNEQTLQQNAEKIQLHSSPAPPVYVYRNAHLALSSFDLQARAAATLPATAWIRNSTGLGGVCRLPPDGSPAYNFSEAAAASFFVNALVREAASEGSAIAGVFFDEVDWATCGFLQSECGGGFTSADVEGLWRATAAAMASATALLAAAGKASVHSLFSAFSRNLGSIDSQPCRHSEEAWLAAMPQSSSPPIARFYGDLGWYGVNGQNASVCAAYIENMIDEANRQPPVGKVVRAVLSASSSEQDVEALAAAALLSYDEHTHIGFSTGWGASDWRWWPGVMGREIGAPLGGAVRSGAAWVREFSMVTAEYSCETREGRLTWRA